MEWFFTALGYGLCHQLPERSFVAGGYQLPVCARDTGIYVGILATALVIAALDRGRRRSEPPSLPVLVIAGLFVGAMATDGLTSYLGLRTTTNDLRLLTGLMAGYGIGVILVPLLNGQLWRGAVRERTLPTWGSIALWLVSLPLLYGGLRFVAPHLGVLYPLIVSVAIIVTFVLVNLVIVTLLPSLERKATRLRDMRAQLLLSALMTVLELGAAAVLRGGFESLL